MFQVPSSLVRPNEAENDEKVPGNQARFTPRESHRLEFCTTLLAPRLLKLLPIPSFFFFIINKPVLASQIHKS